MYTTVRPRRDRGRLILCHINGRTGCKPSADPLEAGTAAAGSVPLMAMIEMIDRYSRAFRVSCRPYSPFTSLLMGANTCKKPPVGLQADLYHPPYKMALSGDTPRLRKHNSSTHCEQLRYHDFNSMQPVLLTSKGMNI